MIRPGWRTGCGPQFDSGEEDVGRMTKILMVDDSKFLRLAMERALARAGYDVSTATDGVKALEVAREKAPVVVGAPLWRCASVAGFLEPEVAVAILRNAEPQLGRGE